MLHRTGVNYRILVPLLCLGLVCSCLFVGPSMAEVGNQWHLATSSADWGPRARFPVLAYNGKMWVLGGGYTGAGNNDVYSSVDGVNWTTVTASAPWAAREWNQSLVFDNKMWVIGGTNPSQDLNDVWYSSDGINWAAATLSAPWAPRCCHSVVTFDNKMWVLGGSNNHGTVTDKNDVWYSSDGANWTQATASAPWSTRQTHTSVVFDGKIWVMGGYRVAGIHLNDIWSSSDGINWTQVTSSAPWGPRTAHSSVVLGGRMWIIGGQWDRNDVWSSSDGLNWTEVVSSADWSGRAAHASVAFNNKLWIFGGFLSGGTPASDVWFSDSVTIPLPPEVVTLPPGSYLMGNSGAPRDVEYIFSHESDRHPVTIDYALQIGKYEITNAQYAEVLNWANASGFLKNSLGEGYDGGDVYHNGKVLYAIIDGAEWSEQAYIAFNENNFIVESRNGEPQDNHPVVRVNWHGAVAFCNWLSEMEGRSPSYDLATWSLTNRAGGGYRLPSESEWEYACRGSVSNPYRYAPYSFGDDINLNLVSCDYSSILDTYMIWCGNINYWSAAVGTKLPNDYGLYDMHGNVWEYCQDTWHDSYNETGRPDDGRVLVHREMEFCGFEDSESSDLKMSFV